MRAHILLVEDDSALAQILSMHFGDAGHEVYHADTLARARELLRDKQPDLMILDQGLPDGKGYDFLCSLQAQDSNAAVIMMTAEHDLELAISAIQAGAFDFVHKPIKTGELDHTVGRALEHRQLALQVEELSAVDPAARDLPKLLGQSEVMLNISKEIALVADSQTRVLIIGESGTGKELVARAIHTHSKRGGPFLAINCAALVENLLESELFGHEKGAFTGAASRKPGKFELAANGTLFLDEIGEMALPLQAKLLRVLQEGSFERVGGSQLLESNARVLAATNRDLAAEVEAGRFREDLFYRLSTITLSLPPLRERQEDISMLMDGLLQRVCRREGKPLVSITDRARALATCYDWPGNIRELENVLTQAVIRGRGAQIDEVHLNLPGTGSGIATTGNGSVPVSLELLEAQHIQFVLNYTSGHKGNTCEILQISRPALDRKIERYQLSITKPGQLSDTKTRFDSGKGGQG
jgi:DNA-binding NtrC family response regulator